MRKTVSVVVMVFMTIGMIVATTFDSEAMTDTTSNIPIMVVDEAKPVVLYSGTQNTLVVTLRNDTLYKAKNLGVTPDVSVTGLSGFRVVNNTFTLENTAVWADQPVIASLEVVIDDTVEEGIYPIRLLLAYNNQSRDYFEREILTYFEVRNDESRKEKVIIKETNVKAMEVVKGEITSFQYSIVNDENYEVHNVKTYLTGLPEAHFAIESTDRQVLIGDMQRNIIKYVTTNYHVNAETPNGSYPYEMVLTYENEEGNKIIRTKKLNLFVGDVTGNSELSIDGVQYPSSVNQDQTFSVSFDVINSGNRTIEDLIITLSDNPIFIPKSASIIKVEAIVPDTSYVYHGEFVASGDDLIDRNYPLEFTLKYNNGSEDVVDLQVLGIYVDSKEEVTSEEGNVPKIIISDYLSEPQIVKAGGEFDLSLDFMNTNRSKTIYNVKAYITADESTEDTGNVFTPVGSSNTFYIDEIGPKNASKQSIRLFTVPDAAPKTYNLNINFEYEDKDGHTYSASEFVGIPVSQVTRVEASDFNVPSELMSGESVNVYFDIFNTGKAKVYNLLIKAEGNMTSDPVSRYIGNFDVGSSDYFDAYVSFNEPGITEGRFIISYDDATGETFVIEKDFTVNVTEPMMPDYMDEGDFIPETYPEPTAFGRLPMIIGAVAGLVMIIIIVLLVRRKKKKNQGLNFDEDN